MLPIILIGIISSNTRFLLDNYQGTTEVVNRLDQFYHSCVTRWTTTSFTHSSSPPNCRFMHSSQIHQRPPLMVWTASFSKQKSQRPALSLFTFITTFTYFHSWWFYGINALLYLGGSSLLPSVFSVDFATPIKYRFTVPHSTA